MKFNSPTTVYTVGHSNLSMERLLSLLQQQSIDTVVDIRAYPYSKRNPQFAQENLRAEVETIGLSYHWAGRQLGGMRKSTGASRHIALQSDSFRAFADYMETAAFKTAIRQLINMADRSRVAVLCAERIAENCHRSLIADYLVLNGINVMHITGPEQCAEHCLNEFARRESMELIYDRAVTSELDF